MYVHHALSFKPKVKRRSLPPPRQGSNKWTRDQSEGNNSHPQHITQVFQGKRHGDNKPPTPRAVCAWKRPKHSLVINTPKRETQHTSRAGNRTKLEPKKSDSGIHQDTKMHNIRIRNKT
ncbi:hypothetical protein AVEN_104669-1 [Araneus ventricosus]|uniref:Uncharacterized protein n=1 Tax=Araneus ventricosus TaxID=182803 RepID=A0A4Y2BEJ9_ARAVE|nr:hypothetical protein AVEN_104669-1 [Araneus ventricosus]